MTFIRHTLSYTILPFIAICLILMILPVFLVTDDVNLLQSLLNYIFEK
jgi:hypothetical protein